MANKQSHSHILSFEIDLCAEVDSKPTPMLLYIERGKKNAVDQIEMNFTFHHQRSSNSSYVCNDCFFRFAIYLLRLSAKQIRVQSISHCYIRVLNTLLKKRERERQKTKYLIESNEQHKKLLMKMLY